MPRKVTGCLALIATLAGGCTGAPHCHDGELVAEYTAEGGAKVTRAPYEGAYALYRRAGPPEAHPSRDGDTGGRANEPCGLRGLFHLWAQDAVGFEQGEGGQLFALAGGEKVPLAPGCYCWHATPENPPSGGQKVVSVLHQAGRTAEAIVVGAVLVGACVGVVGLYVLCAAHTA